MTQQPRIRTMQARARARAAAADAAADDARIRAAPRHRFGAVPVD
jgi:hypothetical protein